MIPTKIDSSKRCRIIKGQSYSMKLIWVYQLLGIVPCEPVSLLLSETWSVKVFTSLYKTTHLKSLLYVISILVCYLKQLVSFNLRQTKY